MSILLLIIGIILFISLIVIHEYGHFLAARRSGVKVEEFGIFFPPAIYRRKLKAGHYFSINWLPLGGFVKLKGEHDSDSEPGSFGAASLGAKVKIMVAGVLMNLVTAIILFTILAWVGMPQLLPNQFNIKSDSRTSSKKVLITYVSPGSPAQKAGLKSEDTLDSIGPTLTQKASALPNITKRYASQTVNITYSRAGQRHQTKATLLSRSVVNASLKTSNPKGYLGIEPTELSTVRSTWSAPIVGLGLTTQVAVLTIEGLGHVVAGLGHIISGWLTGNTAVRQAGQTAASQVAGPVGIAYLIKSFSLLGLPYVIFLIALISLTLAIMNILPLPPMDGGRLWFTLGARAVKRPLSASREEAINLAGLVLILGLFILVTIVDVHRFF